MAEPEWDWEVLGQSWEGLEMPEQGWEVLEVLEQGWEVLEVPEPAGRCWSRT